MEAKAVSKDLISDLKRRQYGKSLFQFITFFDDGRLKRKTR